MEGTSFAIPINRVREIMLPLKEGRAVHHGYVGISLATCTPDWAKQSNRRLPSDANSFPEVHGAIVHKVFPRTPAERGGVRENDVIVEIDGKAIRSSDDARRFIDTAGVGKVRGDKRTRGCVGKANAASRTHSVTTPRFVVACAGPDDLGAPRQEAAYANGSAGRSRHAPSRGSEGAAAANDAGPPAVSGAWPISLPVTSLLIALIMRSGFHLLL